VAHEAKTGRTIIAVAAGCGCGGLVLAAIGFLALWQFLAPSTRVRPPPRPPPAPSMCARYDLTGEPYPPPPALPPLVDEKKELDSLNSLCGDTWCEGSFEFYFFHLGCGGGRCALDMRLYTHVPVTPMPDVSTLERHGWDWDARVLSQKQPSRCAPPCWAKDEIEPPCGMFDVRCEIDVPDGGGVSTQDFTNRLLACIAAIEEGIRAQVPEFAPRK
jgi:hypothetical protein